MPRHLSTACASAISSLSFGALCRCYLSRWLANSWCGQRVHFVDPVVVAVAIVRGTPSGIVFRSTLLINQASHGFTTGTGTLEKSLVLRETIVRL